MDTKNTNIEYYATAEMEGFMPPPIDEMTIASEPTETEPTTFETSNDNVFDLDETNNDNEITVPKEDLELAKMMQALKKNLGQEVHATKLAVTRIYDELCNYKDVWMELQTDLIPIKEGEHWESDRLDNLEETIDNAIGGASVLTLDPTA